MKQSTLPRVTVIGAGMILHDQILPSLYHLQHQGRIGDIHICGTRVSSIKALLKSARFKKGFPGQSFTPYPDPSSYDASKSYPDLYKTVLQEAPDQGFTIIAVPDQLHYEMTLAALEFNQHICVVKPLVLRYQEAETIARVAREKGLFVGVEYHKRFDHRAVMARKAYREGRLGDFRLAQAQMHEPWYYRDSNFQHWFTCEETDMFTYVGCHYVDQVAFITGLRPVAVSVYGIPDSFPNGNKGYLWTDARILWENGACLNVVNAMGSPNAAAGANFQGLTMWGAGQDDGTMLVHSDQYRGMKHSYTTSAGGPGDTVYAEPNPDYMQLLELGGGRLTPVGYGYRSIEAIINACIQVEKRGDIAARQAEIDLIDQEGIVATPKNSNYNELVIEAGRLSILAGGREVAIFYEPFPQVDFKTYKQEMA